MNETDLFKKNCARWALFAEAEAKRLERTLPKRIFLIANSDGSKNLTARISNNQIHTVHAQSNPAGEASEWASRIHLKQEQVLFIYGIGLGYNYEALKSWLRANKKRSVLFLEDDLEILLHFLHTPCAEELLNDKQARLIFLDETRSNIRQLAIEFASKSYAILADNFYTKTKASNFSAIKDTVNLEMNSASTLLKEYGHHGHNFYSNYYRNLLKLNNALLGSNLFGTFENVPAIICGAGPSLAKNVGTLSTLQDNALIFAGSTAMNALNTIGLLPHFGIALDPNIAQFSRLIMNQAFAVPYFYRNRVLHEALDCIHGEHLYLTGTPGHPISKWFEEQLNISNPSMLDEGLGVFNLSLSIANSLGCNPIIFVGADLAYTQEKSYIQGIHNHPIHVSKQHFITKSVNDDVITRSDIFGNPVHTLLKWESESRFVTKFSQKHPEKTLINASEGGIGFTAVVNSTLKEIAKTYLQKQHNLAGKIHYQLQNAALPTKLTKKAIEDSLILFSKSLERAEKSCRLLEDEYRKIQEVTKKQSKAPMLSQQAYSILNDLNKEPSYIYLLKIFDEAYKLQQKHNFEQLKYEPPKAIEPKKAHLTADRFALLQKTAAANKQLIWSALKTEQASQEPSTSTVCSPSPSIEPYSADQDVTAHREYHQNGQLALEQFYLGNTLHGTSTFFYDNGNVSSYHRFAQGKREGTSLAYSINSTIISRAQYKNGQLHGWQETFYATGIVKSKVPYDQGQIHGEVTLWAL